MEARVQIEFLETGSADCPLVRIYGTEADEFAALLDVLRNVATAEDKSTTLHDLPRFNAVSGCQLRIAASSQDIGVRQGVGMDFGWTMTPPKWLLVAGLVEPFASSPKIGEFQWLAGPEARYGLNIGTIGVLLSFSKNGRW